MFQYILEQRESAMIIKISTNYYGCEIYTCVYERSHMCAPPNQMITSAVAW